MEFPSKFSFTVKSTTARPPKTTEPELTAVAGIKGKVKLNEAASKLLGLKPGDYLAFHSNEEQIEEIKAQYAEGEVIDWVEEEGGVDALKTQWGISKGWELIDVNGIPIMTKKPLTLKEEKKLKAEGQVDENGKAIAPDIPSHKGSRLSSKMKELKSGMILECTDSTNAPALRSGYADNMHVVYSISEEPVEAEFENGSETVAVDIYLINFVREDAKIERSN